MSQAVMKFSQSVRRFDERGKLYVWNDLPFTPQRIFSIAGVPENAVRGGHAHKTGSQFICCLQGTFTGTFNQGAPRNFDAGESVFCPPLTWIELSRFQPGTVAVVLCDEPYSPPITDIHEWNRLSQSQTR